MPGEQEAARFPVFYDVLGKAPVCWIDVDRLLGHGDSSSLGSLGLFFVKADGYIREFFGHLQIDVFSGTVPWMLAVTVRSFFLAWGRRNQMSVRRLYKLSLNFLSSAEITHMVQKTIPNRC